MTPQERDIIGRFIERVTGAQPATGSSVPATQPSSALPAIDPEADNFIGQQFQTHPSARYRITQMAFVQEAALAEAQNRIKRLEYDLQNAQSQFQQAQPQPSRGLFGGLFGGGSGAPRPGYAPQPQYAPPPQASYPPGYQPGMFQQGGGSGFLGSALTTAAGVAGGVLAADAISSMFSPHGYGMGGGFGGGGFGMGGGGWGGGEVINETTVNNYGTPDAGGGGGGDPWAGSGTTDSSTWDQGSAPQDQGSGQDAAWGGSGGDAGGSDWGGGDAGGGGGDAGWDDSGSDNSF